MKVLELASSVNGHRHCTATAVTSLFDPSTLEQLGPDA